ncbi:MAG: sigma 54-interacting transcriptional regulator [Candidatus Riflebacteria bacterium]|nr:sigma 54-interacting transcriptional regulator [Candidatus Riflebacteria bacterium]
MTKLFRMVLKVAPTNATVLITGGSGTETELLAQVLHRLSPRASARFVQTPSAPRLKSLEEKEKEYVQEVLEACKGNQTEAARILGISRTSLWRRLTRS